MQHSRHTTPNVLKLAACLAVCAATGALAQTINIDIRADTNGTAYAGSDGVLSGSGTYWNHSANEWQNLKDESGVPTAVDLLKLQGTGWSGTGGGTKIFSGWKTLLYMSPSFDGPDLIYGIHDLDPYKTYDVVLYYGLQAGSAKGWGKVSGEAPALWKGCTNSSDNTLPGREGVTYLRFNGVIPYEVSPNKYGIQVNAEKNSSYSGDRMYLAGIQVRRAGTRANIPPHYPTLLTPTNGTTGVALAPVLTASGFSDPDAGDTHANSQWQVDNGSTFASPEWDTGTNSAATSASVPAGVLTAATTYYWRVRYRDSAGNWSPYSSAQSFKTLSINGAPTNIVLSPSQVAENQASGTRVGSLATQDPDSGNTFTYALVGGTGSTDNGLFAVSGSNLLTLAAFDYETRSNYSIRVQTTDQGGLTTQRVFGISVLNANEAPTNVTLSGASVMENLPIGTRVGSLRGQDPDFNNTLGYALASGTGGGDNALFTVSGSNLLTGASFNYESRSNYSIRVQATDQGGLSTQRVFAITVTDMNETPVLLGIDLSARTNAVLRWSSVTNHTYTLRYTTNLTSAFAIASSNIPATPVVNCYTVAVQGASQRFWQVSTVP